MRKVHSVHLSFPGLVVGFITGIIIAINNPYSFEGTPGQETFQPAIMLFAGLFGGMIIAFSDKLLKTHWRALLVSLSLGILLGIAGIGMRYSSDLTFALMVVALLVAPSILRKAEQN